MAEPKPSGKKPQVMLPCSLADLRLYRAEIGKLRAWLSGFRAANAAIGAMNAGPPGDDSLRQVQNLIDIAKEI